jgi:hypothetical protein
LREGCYAYDERRNGSRHIVFDFRIEIRALIAIGSLCSPVRIIMEDLRSERRGCPREGQQHSPLSVSKTEGRRQYRRAAGMDIPLGYTISCGHLQDILTFTY